MTTSVAASALAELLQEPRLHMYMQPHASSKKKKKMVWLTSEYRKKLKLLVEVRVTGRGLTPQACLQEIPVKVRETDTLVIITVSWRLGCYGGYATFIFNM